MNQVLKLMFTSEKSFSIQICFQIEDILAVLLWEDVLFNLYLGAEDLSKTISNKEMTCAFPVLSKDLLFYLFSYLVIHFVEE